jgi:hypothetical protein
MQPGVVRVDRARPAVPLEELGRLREATTTQRLALRTRIHVAGEKSMRSRVVHDGIPIARMLGGA